MVDKHYDVGRGENSQSSLVVPVIEILEETLPVREFQWFHRKWRHSLTSQSLLNYLGGGYSTSHR